MEIRLIAEMKRAALIKHTPWNITIHVCLVHFNSPGLLKCFMVFARLYLLSLRFNWTREPARNDAQSLSDNIAQHEVNDA